MRTRLRPFLHLSGPKQWQESYAVQVYARGKWCWLTKDREIIKHDTREAAEQERAEMRRRPDPAIGA